MLVSEKAVAGPAVPATQAPAPSIVSSFSTFLRNTWNAWDVRVLVLLSLLLQIALFVLGKRRKRVVRLIYRMILWFAYQSKDWVAIAALGKLSNSHAESPTSNVLRALWAPLLILHLGGPDTVTAFSFHDTQLWTRHLFTLVVQSFLAIYVIYLSWTKFWLSLLTLPLSIAGIIKYVERVLCLKVTYTKGTEWIIPIIKDHNLRSHPLLEKFPESKKVFLGYASFSAIRPDVNDFLCHKEYPFSFEKRIQSYLKDAMGGVFDRLNFLKDMLGSHEPWNGSHSTQFDIAVAELGFIFDVVYTKAAVIYTKKGCFLRLSSLTCSLLVLLLFMIRIMNESEFHFSRVDIFITVCLLVGAVALEFGAVFSMLSSNWAVIVMLFHDSYLVRKILQHVFWPYISSFLSQQKRWSSSMGQFDLMDYCWNSRNTKVNGFLEKICSDDILNNFHRFKYAKIVDVPECLKPKKVYQKRLESFFSDQQCFEATRGEKTLTLGELALEQKKREILELSIKMDFDASIIVWHLATSICYYLECGDCHPNHAPNEAMKSSKYLSDYMMYLLVMQPAILQSEHRKRFWLDRALDELRDPLSKASDKRDACKSLQNVPSEFSPTKSTAVDNLANYAGYLATELMNDEGSNKWELIKAMWIEMLLYAAYSSEHVNHVRQQLGIYGREFLTLIWIMSGNHVVQKVISKMEQQEQQVAICYC